MKNEAVYIDLSNNEQVNWFTTKGQRLAKWIHLDDVIDSATNEPVAIIVMPIGPFKRTAIKEAKSFLGETIQMSVGE